MCGRPRPGAGGQDQCGASSEASRRAGPGALGGASQGPSVCLSTCAAGDSVCRQPPHSQVRWVLGASVDGWELPWGLSGAEPRMVPIGCGCQKDRLPDVHTCVLGDPWSRGGGGADSPFHPININDTHDLEERKEDQVQGSRVLVKNLEPVVSRLQREAAGQEEAGQADQPWTRSHARASAPSTPPRRGPTLHLRAGGHTGMGVAPADRAESSPRPP